MAVVSLFFCYSVPTLHSPSRWQWCQVHTLHFPTVKNLIYLFAVTAKKLFFSLWWKTLLNCLFFWNDSNTRLSISTYTPSPSYPARQIKQSPAQGSKLKTSRKIYNTFVTTTTPSYIISLIWKLLSLSRHHENLMKTLTYSGMNDKQALYLSKRNQKTLKKGHSYCIQ